MAINMDAQTVTAKKRQSAFTETKHLADRISSGRLPGDGANGRGHTKELPTLSPPNGEDLAYSMGMKAGKKHDLTSNPQFSSYSERIAYRAGWMDAMKPKVANVELRGCALLRSPA